MNMSMFQIIAAIVMAGVAFALVIAVRRYMAAASEQRMLSMLECVGLDPADLAGANTETIMKEIRQRCRSCTSEYVCQQWLASKEAGSNDFCPNAKVFETLKGNIDAPV